MANCTHVPLESLESRLLLATYYVDPSGLDAPTSGTLAAPYRTLAYACSRVAGNSGHTIRLNPGLYVETSISSPALGVNIEGSNTSMVPGTPGYDATVITTDTSWSGAKPVIRLQTSGGAAANGNQKLSNFSIDGGNRRASEGIYVIGRDNVELSNLHISYTEFSAINYTAENVSDSAWIEGGLIRNVRIEHGSKTGGSNTVTYSNTGLAPSTTYYYRVRSINANGASAFSNVASATTLATGAAQTSNSKTLAVSYSDGAVPSAPTGLTATAVAANQVNISFTDLAKNETGFRIERSTTSNFAVVTVINTLANPNTGTSSSSGAVSIGGWRGGEISGVVILNDHTYAQDGFDDGYGIKAAGPGKKLGVKVFDCSIVLAQQDESPWYSDAAIEFWHVYGDATWGANEFYNISTNQWFSFVYGNKGTGTRSVYVHNNRQIFTTDTQHRREAVEVNVSDLEYAHNYAENAFNGVAFWHRSTTPVDIANTLVHRNVFRYTVATESYGLRLESRDSVRTTNTQFYNNVVDGADTGVKLYNRSAQSSIEDTTVRNNIFMNLGTAVVRAPVDVSGTSGSQINDSVFSNNLIYNTPNVLANIGTGVVIDWDAASSPNANPGLVQSGAIPETYYYPASALSPVVNAGVHIPGITTGFIGARPEVGVFERQPPSTPTNFAATSSSPTQINLAWTDTSNEEAAFVLQRSLTGTTGWTTVYRPAVNAQAYSDTALVPGTRYYYRLQSTNNAGGSQWSSTATAVTDPIAPLTLEAEDQIYDGGARRQGSIAGYTGTGYVDFNGAGGYFEFSYSAPTAGTYTVSFRYGSGPSRNVALDLNGVSQSGGVTFASTGTFANWTVYTISLAFNAGVNTVRLTAIGQDGPNVDSLTIAYA